ncbi:hypothetical protein GUJ93_ZPchr0005g15762 [Zizania palustris]|uniref:Uncharacterized protein n=1 Tax=Zizania palustris TaxID=103762 RepID=A0A8J5VRC0_ZIZPA|nr:hypothetical protein GUJ93_ZPchr0005g15762 [Zizania palustris]
MIDGSKGAVTFCLSVSDNGKHACTGKDKCEGESLDERQCATLTCSRSEPQRPEVLAATGDGRAGRKKRKPSSRPPFPGARGGRAKRRRQAPSQVGYRLRPLTEPGRRGQHAHRLRRGPEQSRVADDDKQTPPACPPCSLRPPFLLASCPPSPHRTLLATRCQEEAEERKKARPRGIVSSKHLRFGSAPGAPSRVCSVSGSGLGGRSDV